MTMLAIKDFPDYFVDDEGNVYSRKYHPIQNKYKKLKKMVAKKDKYGYLVVCISKDRKHYFRTIHRLVAQTFIPNPENKPQVNHISGDKTNNNVCNLEWVSAQENSIHRVKILKKIAKGKPVLQMKNNIIIAKFCSANEAARAIGIHRNGINAVCRGVHKTAGGYQWKYKDINNG